MRFAVLLSLSLCACGLGIVGVGGSDDGGVAPIADGASPDPIEGGTQADGDAPTPAECTKGSCAALGADWSPRAVPIDPSAACPADYDANVLKADPVVAEGACGCAVATRQLPSCETGTLAFRGGDTCGTPSVSYPVKDHGCVGVSSTTVGPADSFKAFPPTGAACTAQATSDPTKLTTRAMTLCAPKTCPDAICEHAAPPGFRACIVAQGDRKCDVAGFSVKHVVGRDISLVCSPACTCVATGAACTNVRATFYDRSGCGENDILVRYQPDQCTSANNAEGNSIGSVNYTATPVATFTPSAAKPAAVDVNTQRTLCCAP